MKQLIKKYKLVIGVLLVFNFNNTKAQINLINDPSFEDTISTTNGLTHFSLLHWDNLDSNNSNFCPTGYLNMYSSNLAYLLPINQWCMQNPKSGNGIIGFDFVFVPTPQMYHRLIVRGKLKSKLIQGQTYCAKMFVNPAERFARYTQDGIAMYFDNGQLDTIVATDSSGVYPFVQPQVSNPQGNVITDTMGWTMVSGTFVANGTEEFITIGNFKTDANTDTAVILPSSNWLGSELLIDDVSLYPINASNWLHDASGTLGDSTLIGLPNYEVPDGQWFTYNMQPLGSGSQIKVKNTQAITQYIQAVDVCNSVIYDTMTVYAYPLSNFELGIKNFELKVFPNPASNILTISVNSLINQPVFISNTSGQIVVQQILQQPATTIDISQWASGVYVVRYAGVVKKLVVQ
ncbi:MAG: hypothetical protein RLZZ118_206 [Bacteroidota bacterium]|jgi:hypothetical protein